MYTAWLEFVVFYQWPERQVRIWALWPFRFDTPWEVLTRAMVEERLPDICRSWEDKSNELLQRYGPSFRWVWEEFVWRFDDQTDRVYWSWFHLWAPGDLRQWREEVLGLHRKDEWHG